jgi:heme oxygenase
MNAQPPPVRSHLRAATDEIHQALHTAAPFAAIAEGRATLAAYGGTLRFLHRFHSAMAPLCALGAAALDAPELGAAHAARLVALKDDLAHFGLAVDAEPDSSTGDANDNGDFCAGVLYTVQGSTLGGKVIFSQLDYLLSDDAGRRFFKGGADDGKNWRRLCAALDQHGGDLGALEAGARHGFARFQDMLGADNNSA